MKKIINKFFELRKKKSIILHYSLPKLIKSERKKMRELSHTKKSLMMKKSFTNVLSSMPKKQSISINFKKKSCNDRLNINLSNQRKNSIQRRFKSMALLKEPRIKSSNNIQPINDNSQLKKDFLLFPNRRNKSVSINFSTHHISNSNLNLNIQSNQKISFNSNNLLHSSFNSKGLMNNLAENNKKELSLIAKNKKNNKINGILKLPLKKNDYWKILLLNNNNINANNNLLASNMKDDNDHKSSLVTVSFSPNPRKKSMFQDINLSQFPENMKRIRKPKYKIRYSFAKDVINEEIIWNENEKPKLKDCNEKYLEIRKKDLKTGKIEKNNWSANEILSNFIEVEKLKKIITNLNHIDKEIWLVGIKGYVTYLNFFLYLFFQDYLFSKNFSSNN